MVNAQEARLIMCERFRGAIRNAAANDEDEVTVDEAIPQTVVEVLRSEGYKVRVNESIGYTVISWRLDPDDSRHD